MSLAGQKARLAKYKARISRGDPLPIQISKEAVEKMEVELNPKAVGFAGKFEKPKSKVVK